MAKKHRNPVFRPLVKFSIYGLVCLALLFVLAIKVGNLTPPTHKRSMYHAVLSDASSLVGKDDVKIAGVTVGQVHGVKVHQGKAVITFSLDSNLHIRANTSAGLRFQNVIGAKYLYLYPSTDGDILKPGATLSHEVAGADVGNFLIDVGGFLKALNPSDVNAFTRSIVTALQDNQTQVSSLIDNTATVSQTLGNLDTNVAHIVDNLNSVLTALQSRDKDLATVVDRLSSVAADLATRNDVIDNVIANLTTVNGDLSQLVNANKTNVDQIVNNLETVTHVLTAHTSDLNRDLTTAPDGLASYIEISKLGQWFSIRVVYTCLAISNSCTYEQPLNQPASLANPPAPVPGGTVNVAGAVALPSGARPIGPPLPQSTFQSVYDFAAYGNGQG